jgi:type I restriction enzyme S subunit
MIGDQNKNQLQKDWKNVMLGDVCETTSGGTPDRKQARYYSGNIPWVKSGELGKGMIRSTEERISEEGLKNSSAKLFPKGTLLIALYGATIGKLAFLDIEAATNQAVCGIYKNEVVDSYFLYYYLLYKRQMLVDCGTGGAQPNISQTILKRLEFPLPPKPIQQAIVSKIEELFSELDKGVESLRKAQRQLKTYRQSVLKSAFEGKLTNENIKEGELPNDWFIRKLGECISTISSGKSYRCDERPPRNEEVGIVKVSSVTWGIFDEQESKTCFSNEFFNEKYQIEPGDFLFSRANTIELIGACVVVGNVRKNLMLSDKILRFVFKEDVNKKYVLYYLRSRVGRRQIEMLSTGNQDSMRNIGQEKIKQIEFPYCLIEDQLRIVDAIESRLSVADKLEEAITQSLQQAETLKQSIFKKAFEGKLI